jgi:1,2-diacylglycerol 3-beta-galactosyltransferase
LTIQILMSDTGGGHRASAQALRDAVQSLYNNNNKDSSTKNSAGAEQQMPRIECDIVDIYSDYGNVWPYNEYPQLYKLLAANPWSWAIFYWLGATPLGLAVNELLLQLFCYDSFQQCLQRLQPTTGRRADLVVSVHPLTNSLPLKILRQLDAAEGRHHHQNTTTPFCTVVTDLGSAHPTWFCPGYVIVDAVCVALLG